MFFGESVLGKLAIPFSWLWFRWWSCGGHSAGVARRTAACRGSRHGDGGKSDAGALHFTAAAAGVRPDAEKRVAGAEGGSSGTAGAFERAEGAEVPDAGTGAAGGDPLPGTGAWTGALVADVLDIRMRTALPAIAAGVIIAGCITTAVTCGVAGLM